MVVGHLPSKGKALSSNPGTSKRVFKIISVHMFSLSLEVVLARHWWLTPVILAIQEAEIRRIMVQSQQFARPYLKNTQHKKALAEWLKV
jgi:hypothetical protein